MYGVRGNRVNNAVTGWMISVCCFAPNLAAAAAAAFSLVARTGLPVNDAVKAVVVVLIAAVTLAISVYGHAAIDRLYVPITLALMVVFAVVAVAVVRHADFGYAPDRPLSGGDLWVTMPAGVALMASGPLSYTTGADFSRYLPRTTSARAVAGWTALGGFLPSVVVCGIGAAAATAVDMSDPESALQPLLPNWFRPVFLLALVLGTVALNALTAYSAGLALQAVGIRVRRSFSDILLRRNRYDGLALADETPTGPSWYRGGVNWSGAPALAVGVTASALCVDTVYTGPLAAALGGVDLALPAGLLVASAVYALLMRRLRTTA